METVSENAITNFKPSNTQPHMHAPIRRYVAVLQGQRASLARQQAEQKTINNDAKKTTYGIRIETDRQTDIHT